jgi:hypothetical protein
MDEQIKLDPLTELLLDESKRTSTTRITRATKIKKSVGQLSSASARKANDPLYKRMIYYRELYFKFRNQLHRKYAPRVRSRAMR